MEYLLEAMLQQHIPYIYIYIYSYGAQAATFLSLHTERYINLKKGGKNLNTRVYKKAENSSFTSVSLFKN